MLDNMNETISKDKLSTANDLPDVSKITGAQEMAEFAEKATIAVEKVETERDEYRSLFAKSNATILKQKEEIRYLKDRVANKDAESLRQTTMSREKMNIQLQKDATLKELDNLLDGSFENLIENRRNR